MPDAAIRLQGLAKYYGSVIGVENMSLDVRRGEVFGFLGANGAGKSTTIRLLLDLLRPTRGSASVLGFDCHRQSMEARRRIGYLPGELPVYPDLSAAGYLDYLQRLDGRPVSSTYLAELLQRLDVSDVDLRRRLRDQSHGMKQKIGIVAALMARPPVVVLDEPTAGLDPFMVHAFREIVEDLRRAGDTTVFLSSHVLNEVDMTCDRVGIIRGGRIVHVTGLDELKRRAPRRVVVEFAADVPPATIPDVKVLPDGPRRWTLEVEGDLGPVLRSLQAWPVRDLRAEPFSLERHLLSLYRDGTALPGNPRARLACEPPERCGASGVPASEGVGGAGGAKPPGRQ